MKDWERESILGRDHFEDPFGVALRSGDRRVDCVASQLLPRALRELPTVHSRMVPPIKPVAHRRVRNPESHNHQQGEKQGIAGGQIQGEQDG
jgi:hypothetical protein